MTSLKEILLTPSTSGKLKPLTFNRLLFEDIGALERRIKYTYDERLLLARSKKQLARGIISKADWLFFRALFGEKVCNFPNIDHLLAEINRSSKTPTPTSICTSLAMNILEIINGVRPIEQIEKYLANDVRRVISDLRTIKMHAANGRPISTYVQSSETIVQRTCATYVRATILLRISNEVSVFMLNLHFSRNKWIVTRFDRLGGWK